MKTSHQIAGLVHQLSRLIQEDKATKPLDLDAMRADLLKAQPIPTDGQLCQLAAIERGEKVSNRNRDVKRISWLGYVGQREDGSLLLTSIGRAVLKHYQK